MISGPSPTLRTAERNPRTYRGARRGPVTLTTRFDGASWSRSGSSGTPWLAWLGERVRDEAEEDGGDERREQSDQHRLTVSPRPRAPRARGGTHRVRAGMATESEAMPRIAVLDDDPTGSQTVHDVAIVLALDDDELRLSGDTTFFLTNTRSLPEAEAAALTERVARTLFERYPDVEIVSRSDSTLRGHVAAEIAAIAGRAPFRTTACCWSRRSSRPGASPAATSTTRATRRSGRPSSPATPRSATRART